MRKIFKAIGEVIIWIMAIALGVSIAEFYLYG